MPRRHQRLLVLLLVVASAAVALSLMGGQRASFPAGVLAARLDGCGPHATYVTACDVGAGSFSYALPAAGAVNFYRIGAPPAGQALRVQLDQSAGLQAALIRDASGVAGPVTGGLTNARPQNAVDEFGPAIPDESGPSAQPQTTIQPYPAPFEEIPFEEIPFEEIPFQSTPFEEIAAEHPGFRPIQLVALVDGSNATQVLTHFSDALDASDLRPAQLVLAVWSDQPVTAPYSVTVAGLAPDQTCTPGAGSVPPLPDGFTPVGTAAPSAPDGVTTLIIIDEERWARLYGADGSSTVMAQLAQLAASPLVNGTVLSVDADPGVAQSYADWDADLCSATKANVVAARIRRLVTAFTAAHPGLSYLVVAGDDSVVPFFRVPDDARIANEVQYAGQTGLTANGADEAAFVRRNLLTDDYYADPHGSLSGSRILYSPQIAIGRLVESPADITAAVQTFLARGGVLNAASGLVTGYDFLRRTADTVAGAFTGRLTPLTTLDGDGWSPADVDAALAGGPDLVFFSGHFAHGAMQTASLDAYPATALAGNPSLAGKLFFSVGCHMGASIPDNAADPSTGYSAFDWAQAVTGLGGVLVANTGYGYGDSDAPAYGQELMTDFAAQLAAAGADQPLPIGRALVAAKQLYRARNDGKWDGYHTKTMMEATLYGLPMYALALPGSASAAPPSAPPDLPATPASPPSPAPSAARAGAVWAQAPSGPVVYHAEIDVPPLTRQDSAAGNGSYYASPDGIDVRLFQPVQPQLTFRLPQLPGMTVHGVLTTGATYSDVNGFDPIIMRPIWDHTEPEPQFQYTQQAPLSPTLVNAQPAANGDTVQNLVLTAGQFRSTGQVPAGGTNTAANGYLASAASYPHTVGRERLYQHFSLDIFYSSSTNLRPPALAGTSIACTAAGTAGLTTMVQSGAGVSRVDALLSFGGQQTVVPLPAAAPGWQATIALPGPGVEITLRVVEAAGNVTERPLALASDVAGGCSQANQPPANQTQTPSPTPSPQPGASATPPSAGRPLGTIRILTLTNVPTAAVVPAQGEFAIAGVWGTGGPSCTTPGATWTIIIGVAAGATTAPPTAFPAPCGADGNPLSWQADPAYPAIGVPVQVCAGIAYGVGTSLSGADATDCRTFTPPSAGALSTPTPTPSPAAFPTPSPSPSPSSSPTPAPTTNPTPSPTTNPTPSPTPTCIPSPGQRCRP